MAERGEDYTARAWRETTEPGTAVTAIARQLTTIMEQPPWSMVSKSPEEARALWDLLITEWPPDTPISEIARFISTLDRRHPPLLSATGPRTGSVRG